MLIHKFQLFWLQRLKRWFHESFNFLVNVSSKIFFKNIFSLYLFLCKISTPKWLYLTSKDYDWILSIFIYKKSGFFNACLNYSGQYSTKIFEDIHLFLCENSMPLWGPTLAPEIMIWKLLFAISEDVFILVSAFLTK